jgi:transcriptional regulator with XRE-family HTH domain
VRTTGRSPIGFATRLRALRDERGWTQQELARLANCARPNIAMLERENCFPSVPLLLGLADAFGVSTDYLLGRTAYRHWEATQRQGGAA